METAGIVRRPTSRSPPLRRIASTPNLSSCAEHRRRPAGGPLISTFSRRRHHHHALDAAFGKFLPVAFLPSDGAGPAVFLAERLPFLEANRPRQVPVGEADGEFVPETLVAEFLVALVIETDFPRAPASPGSAGFPRRTRSSHPGPSGRLFRESCFPGSRMRTPGRSRFPSGSTTRRWPQG